MNTRTVHDPFRGEDVQISNRLTDRLRGRYAVGPTMPNGEPEFGWRQHDTPPIQREAAGRIDALEAALREITTVLDFANGGKLVEAAAEKANRIARAALAPEQDHG